MVPCGIADILQVVVLATRAHAALRAYGAHIGPLVLAEKYFLELHHARIGEQQRRIVGGNEGARRHDRMAVRLEEFKKLLSYFATFHIDFI